MIGKVRGKVDTVELEHVIVDVAGVGYKVFASAPDISKCREGEDIEFWTHLAVRENALDLYGFFEKEERTFFELLLGVSGIGPKSALGVLSVAPAATLRAAIASGDTSYLTKVSGIGNKTAQKIVIELKDKIGALYPDEGGLRSEESDVIDALTALGYSRHDAREALKSLDKDIKGTQNLIREALKQLGT